MANSSTVAALQDILASQYNNLRLDVLDTSTGHLHDGTNGRTHAALPFTTNAISTTALATPSALAATQFTAFASTVSGATLMGYGTTGDVTLKNRAGTTVLGIDPNATGVTMAGALAITGALSGVTTLATSGGITNTGAAATNTSGLVLQGTTTAWNRVQVSNTSGGFIAGVEGSVAGTIATGTSAYASVIGDYGNKSLEFATNNTVRLAITNVGNLKLAGSAARATTEGTNHLDIFDGTAPVGTLANGISLYSTAGELRVMDSAGTATLLSPHDDDGNWVFDSVDTTTGRRLLIDVEKLLRAVNDRFGWDFIHEAGIA